MHVGGGVRGGGERGCGDMATTGRVEMLPDMKSMVMKINTP